MTELNTTELAVRLGVSKGRVSQWVSEGKLRGCFTGDGRNRRFNLEAVGVALGKTIDIAQGLGNGRKTLQAISAEEIAADELTGDELDGLTNAQKARYDAARTMLVEERARAARYDNSQREGTLLLAAEVERQVIAQIGQEMAAFESYIRAAAKVVADANNLSPRAVRQQLLQVWRQHRGERATGAEARAAKAKATTAEKAADF
jgi:excisionase family DNA binding protein